VIVKMRTTMCGPGGNFYPDQVVDHPDGAALVRAGYAEPCDASGKPLPQAPPPAVQPETAEKPDTGETADAGAGPKGKAK
jgi:hypothetical protein